MIRSSLIPGLFAALLALGLVAPLAARIKRVVGARKGTRS